MLRSQNLPIASLKHDIASCFTVTGAKINDLVGGAHHARFMLYDHDRISEVAQLLHDLHQLRGIARMQPNTRFIQNIQRVYQPSAQARSKIHSLRFTARERACRAVERQISKPDIQQILKP